MSRGRTGTHWRTTVGPTPTRRANSLMVTQPSGSGSTKAEGVAAALAGFCTSLNKVGHHRAPRPAEERLPAMPVDQWEAEMALAAGQYFLAYAERVAGPEGVA